MQPPRVHDQALHQKGGAPPDGIAAVCRDFLQEFLMTKQRVGGARGLELFQKCGLPEPAHSA